MFLQRSFETKKGLFIPHIQKCVTFERLLVDLINE